MNIIRRRREERKMVVAYLKRRRHWYMRGLRGKDLDQRAAGKVPGS